MKGKIELTEKAEKLFMTAKEWGVGAKGNPMYFINRQLGWEMWNSKGQRGGRRDVRELFSKGLVAEWFSPWSPPLYLTSLGKEQLKLRNSSSYLRTEFNL